MKNAIQVKVMKHVRKAFLRRHQDHRGFGCIRPHRDGAFPALSAAVTGFLSRARAPRINATIFAMRQIRPAAPPIRLSQFISPSPPTFSRERAAQKGPLETDSARLQPAGIFDLRPGTRFAYHKKMIWEVGVQKPGKRI
jgi:hypothetical protein